MPEIHRVCPVCGNDRFNVFLEGKDYFLTSESFSIIQCSTCGFRITDPVPGKEEIGRYYESDEYISHDAKDKNLLNTVYKMARFFTLRSKYRLVKKYAGGSRLMDIGCGTGEFLGFCKGRGYDVSGVEPNPKAREFAARTQAIPVRAEIVFGEEEKGNFDCITMWHVLEHIPDLDKTLGLIRDALRKSGTLILALPNPDSWDAKYYGEHWAAFDLPRHLYHFSSGDVTRLAAKNGFSVRKILPQYLDSFYISLLSENYKRGKKDPFRGFFNGLRSNLHAPGRSFGYSSHIYILTANIS